MKARIGFVLPSPLHGPMPSTRIAILNMLPYLHDGGFETHILFEPPGSNEAPHLPDIVDRAVALGIDIVYFQKVRGPSVLETVTRLGARGIKTVYGVCDLIENGMAEATDATVVVTDYLRSLYDRRLHGKMHVVHDGIENPDCRVGQYRPDIGSRRKPLKAVLVTSSELLAVPAFDGFPPQFRVTIVGRYRKFPVMEAISRRYRQCLAQPTIAERGRFLRNLVRRDLTKVHWDIETVYELMAASDIGIIPVDMSHASPPARSVPHWRVKSENRLTMKMALGLPVIASPVPSYENVIVQGENGYLASTREEWLACLEELRDPERRQAMGRRARESVIRRYSKEEQARKLIAVLRQLTEAGSTKPIEPHTTPAG